jgi:hypothetical protein
MKYYRGIGIDSITNCIMGRGKWNSCFQHGSGNCKTAKKTGEYYSPCLNLIDEEILFTALKNLNINLK